MMAQVNSKFNQNKPTTERNKRRKSEPQNVVGKSAYGGRKNTKRVGGKSDPQETVIQETVKQQTERKNAEPDKPTTPDQDDSFIPSSTPSSFSQTVPSVAIQVHSVQAQRNGGALP